ncbi:hypothetical protein [Reyranella sp.]|uniref:hypothetical protein n=1 Tax=Reyranella sp. TaxID=1929291 RepID=UPI000BD186EF|nr:hypothetical protein [Reyranella sp.]OYY40616.1 MAG: hypothetical protein B7Y57_16315 [Rhodospirillales bacterium 35-66-84]OYZ93176.1 MAG: hypothetical protein B7Y08_17560 [Rhodospirillales bacterium 24-66-33]OZB24588.1 MAG: hypothetical protein B7X63_15520 [Rhodospirillales bacterium 39-66-50]HQS18110.1 hypothetical protein [Reyranella sp.]HQT14685.1 hypothetical protein [Reyranella sp.]
MSPSLVRSGFLGFLLLSALPSAAQDTVTVGGEKKRAFGTPTAFQNGDAACYLTLKDDRGGTFEELADFDLCSLEKSLKGKRLALTYKTARVMAASCQGNPDCKKSETVVLIASAKPAPLAAPAPAPAAPSPAKSAQTSFCTPTETIVFSCRTSPTKLVSVCASKDAAPNRGYLQYRTGKPDSSEPLDLTLPAAQLPPPQAASGESFPLAGGGATWLRVSTKNNIAFVVYTGIGNWGPRGETREKAGVTVERDGKTVASLKCTGKPLGLLGPDWFAKVGLTAKGQDFDLPD